MDEIAANPLFIKIEERAKEVGYKDITALCAATKASRGALTDLKYNRTRELSVKTIAKLAPALRVSVNFFTDLEGEAQKKAPTVSGERSVSDEDIKFALFGGDGDITDEMYEEVKSFAKFIKQRETNKK